MPRGNHKYTDVFIEAERRERSKAARVEKVPVTLQDYAVRAKRYCQSSYMGCDFTDEEAAFMRALDWYKRHYHRPHPTTCEVLAVLAAMGFRRVDSPDGQLPPHVVGGLMEKAGGQGQ